MKAFMGRAAARGRTTLARGGLVAALLATPGAGAVAGSAAFETYGDVGQLAIPAIAAAVSVAKADYNGTAQLVAGSVVTFGTVQGLKYAVNTERPNGGDRSFPSGHTSGAFSGASYLHYRYGWEYGLPAYLAAAAVGASRVDAGAHYWYDVVGGAAIANLIAYVLTDTIDENVVVIPVIDKSKANFEVLLRLGIRF